MNRTLMNAITLSACILTTVLSGCGGESAGSSTPTNSGGGDSSGTSQAGSTAAMLTFKDVLYILNRGRLHVYDISSSDETVLAREVVLPAAETLFIYDDYLYVGGRAGVDILNIDDPFYPVKVNAYPHVRGCDPVVVSSGIGYVTLRNRPGCGGDVNRLEVVDFTDPLRPKLLGTFNMDFPFGLAKTDSYLAVCQEQHGLSLLDVSVDDSEGTKAVAIKEKIRFFDVQCFDAIAAKDSLIVTAKDGIYQFGIDGVILSTLSKIPVGDGISQSQGG